MQIYYKPIKLKKNEWLPQERIYNNRFWLLQIIKEEELDKDMICVQNVGFDSVTQTFTNVEMNCNDYNDEFIYYIKADNITFKQQYFWGYITNKTYDTRLKIQLELTIDVISSNFENFDNEKFRGKYYIDRTTESDICGVKVWRSINNIHSDICNNINNPIYRLAQTIITINKDIDVFVDRALTKEREITILAGTEQKTLKINEIGTMILNNNTNKFLAYKSTFNYNNLNFDSVKHSDITIQDLLNKYGQPDAIPKYEEPIWGFSGNNYELMLEELRDIILSTLPGLVQSNVQQIIQDESVNNWLTIPKIFDGIENNIIQPFEINFVPYYDVTKHENMHNIYSLIYGKFLKIPLDMQKLKENLTEFGFSIIYGTRIINNDGANFKFYYNKSRTEEFYNISLGVTNGTLSTQSQQFERELTVAYNSGVKADQNFIPNFLEQTANSIAAFSIGKGFGVFNLASNIITLPFDIYKEHKNDNYQRNLINTTPRQSTNIIQLDALNSTIVDDVIFYSFGSTLALDASGYFTISKSKLSVPKEVNFSLSIESPIIDDVEKIEIDQQQFGPIVNKLFLDISNPICDSRINDESYYQGKIQPNFNPVNNFMLDLINTILAQGIRIKNRWDGSENKKDE